MGGHELQATRKLQLPRRFNTLTMRLLGLAAAVVVVMMVSPRLVSSGYVDLGNVCFIKGAIGPAERGYDACISHLQLVLDVDEDNYRARRALANIALRSGRYAEAEEMLAELLLDPDSNIVDLYRFALVSSLDRMPDESLVEALRGKIDSHSLFMLWREYCCGAQPRPDWVLPTVRLAYAIDAGWGNGERAMTARALGEWLAASGDMEGARQIYAVALESYRADGDLPMIGLIYRKLGQMAEQEGDFEDARQKYALALESYRADGSIESMYQVKQIYWQLGQRAEHEGDFEAAADAYRNCIKSYPKEALFCYRALGFGLRSRGYSLDDITREFRQFVSGTLSEDPYVYAWPMNVLLRMGSPLHARHFLEMADSAQRETPVMLTMTARLLVAEGDTQQAEMLYRRIIARSTDPLGTAAMASELARLLSARGDLDGSLEMWELATTLQPEVAGYWYGLGSVQKERSALDVARSALRQALQLDPNLSEAQTLLQQIEQ